MYWSLVALEKGWEHCIGMAFWKDDGKLTNINQDTHVHTI